MHGGQMWSMPGSAICSNKLRIMGASCLNASIRMLVSRSMSSCFMVFTVCVLVNVFSTTYNMCQRRGFRNNVEADIWLVIVLRLLVMGLQQVSFLSHQSA